MPKGLQSPVSPPSPAVLGHSDMPAIVDANVPVAANMRFLSRGRPPIAAASATGKTRLYGFGLAEHRVGAARRRMERTRAIERACLRHAVPLRVAALQFPLSHPVVTTVIPGARDAAEDEENLRLMAHPIPYALWLELRQAGLVR